MSHQNAWIQWPQVGALAERLPEVVLLPRAQREAELLMHEADDVGLPGVDAADDLDRLRLVEDVRVDDELGLVAGLDVEARSERFPESDTDLVGCR